MRLAKIKPNDSVNGEGVVVSVWTQGCSHHCKGCFNQETWDFDGGREYTEEDKNNILKMMDANGIKRNLSILGGDPFADKSIEDVIELCNFIKEKKPDRKIFIWTGYLFEELIEKFGPEKFSSIDVIIDGRFEEDKKDIRLKLRGSSNQRIINVHEFLHKVEGEN